MRISKVAEFLLIRGLCLVFIIALYRAAFCSVLASVFIVFSQASVFQIYFSSKLNQQIKNVL